MAFRAPVSIEEIAASVGVFPGEAGLKHRADRERRRWRGVRLMLAQDGSFVVGNSWEVRQDLKDMGFRWSAEARAWGTSDERIAAKLADRATGAAKERMVPHLRIGKAKATFERAATRLEAGDEERVRASLTPAIASSIRQAVAVLAACDDDKATVINKKGFSKADTELGHTLHLSGVRTFREAALALKLTWRYRGQLPAHVVDAAFPVHEDAEPSEAEKNAFVAQAEADAAAVLTREDADAVCSFFDDDADAAMDQLLDTGAFLPHEPTLDASVPGQPCSRTRIAAVEGNRSLFYCDERNATHWLEVA